MKDKLENFIAQHRVEFDEDQVPIGVWTTIEKHLSGTEQETKTIVRPMVPLMRVMQVAAMFVVVMGVGLMIGLQINSKQIYDDPRLSEFVEVERHYSNQIENMWTAVKATGIEDERSVAQDLESLDQIYNELREELLSGPNTDTDEVVNAMIKNYRTKIEILEAVLDKNTNQQPINKDDENLEI